MLYLSDYLMGRDKEYPPTEKMIDNAMDLLKRVHGLMVDLGIPLEEDCISSGYRPGKYNAAAGGASKSGHLDCTAIDLKDPKAAITKKIMTNLALLTKYDLYLEEPAHTKGWVHLDTKKRKNRVFRPF